MDRISRIEFIYGIINLLEKRSTCERGQVGALAMRDNRILMVGYNGAPSGRPHCIDVGCEEDGDKEGCIRTIHAEANLISLSSRYGISLEGADIFCSYTPCLSCAQLMVNSNIGSFNFFKLYRDGRGFDLLRNCGIDTQYYINNNGIVNKVSYSEDI